MRTRVPWKFCGTVAVGLAIHFTPSAIAAPGDVIPGNYIVALRLGAGSVAVTARHGVAASHHYNAGGPGFAAQLSPAALGRLQQDASVAAIIPDREVGLFAGKPGGGTTPPPAQVTPLGVTRVGSPGSGYNGSGIGVAVVDTGVDLLHADLSVSATSYSAVGTATGQDDHGHGTHVAGIVAALDNTRDVVGVAPGAIIYAVKVLNRRGSGSDSQIMAGLNWVFNNRNAVTPNIKVVNMSLGRPGTLNDNTELRNSVAALTAAGITVVVAAGNDPAVEVKNNVPATYPEVIAVASTTAVNGTSTYPNFGGILADTASYYTTDGAFVGNIGVTISAPGEDQENVNSTGGITSVGILSLKKGGGTTRMSGTSMAAPHVAGVAALLHQQAGATGIGSEAVRAKLVAGASNPDAPLASPTASYTADGDLEGVLSAPGALAAP